MPNDRELDTAADLHAHLIRRGRMHNFFDILVHPRGRHYGVIPKFDPGSITVGSMDHDNLKIPIFSGLFQRQQDPRECIVCTEEKYEIDYGTLDQWAEDCVGYAGLWMWSILEYPTSAIQSCDHDFDVCRSCTAKHIAVSLENGDIDRITCPQCNRVLSYDEIRNLAEAETFERL